MPGMGFRLARSKGMEGSTGNLHEYPIATGYTTRIFKGDLCTLNAGNVQVSAGGAAAKVLGIFWGCKYHDADGSVKFSPQWDGAAGRTNIKAMVAVMPAGATMLVKGQDGAVYTQADVGVLKPVDATTAGDQRTGQSRQTLGAPGASVANTPLIVLGEVDIPDGGSGRWFEVALASANAIELVGA